MPLLRSRPTGGESVIAERNGKVLVRIPTEVSEQIDYLMGRLSIQQAALPSSLLVTSHLSGEGVSLVSAALASSIGRGGRACLIETNWDGRRLPVTDEIGLVDVVAGRATLADAVLPTSRPGLSILPVGDRSDPVARVPVGSDLGPVLRALTPTFDMVVVDAPALAASPFALEAAALIEASILVVRQGVTDVEQVTSAAAKLEPFGFRGAVLTANSMATPGLIRRWGSGR